MAPSVSGLRAAAVLAALAPAAAHAQSQDAELARKLSNPVASLISVPVQSNYDCCYGPSDGGRVTVNLQPVIPVSLGKDWNVIIRTIVPVVHQEQVSPGTGDHFGLSDTVQSFFFSPKAPVNGMIVAFGPVFLYPTGTDHLSGREWGAGPTGLVLKQSRGKTIGLLVNHIWSYAGPKNGQSVSTSFIQPFFSVTTPTATTYAVNAEATYNWKTEAWTVPVNLSISHVYKFGNQRVSLGGGPRIYLAHEGGGPEWGARFTATWLFPK